MADRRTRDRERVVYGATVQANGITHDCVVKNLASGGACLVLAGNVTLPDQISIYVPRKNRTFRGRITWWRNDTVGVMFEADDITAIDLLQRQLARTTRMERELKSRLRDALGEA